MVAGARELSAMAGGVEAKAEKITQANTITQPSRQMAGVAFKKATPMLLEGCPAKTGQGDGRDGRRQ